MQNSDGEEEFRCKCNTYGNYKKYSRIATPMHAFAVCDICRVW